MKLFALAAGLLLFTGAARAQEAAPPPQADGGGTVATGSPTDLSIKPVRNDAADAGTTAPDKPSAQQTP